MTDGYGRVVNYFSLDWKRLMLGVFFCYVWIRGSLWPKFSLSSLATFVLYLVSLVSLCVHESSTYLTFCLSSHIVSFIACVLPISLLSRYDVFSPN